MKRFKKERNQIIILAAVLITVNLLLEELVGYEVKDFMNKNRQLLADMHFRDNLNDLESDVLLIESRVRGLVVTGKREFIANIDDDWDHTYSRLDEILKVTNANPRLETLGDSLNILVRKKLTFNKKIITLYETRGKQEAENLIATAIGKKLREDILDLCRQLNNIKLVEIREIEVAVKKDGDRALLADLILPMIVTLVLCVVVFMLIRKLRHQERLFNEIEKSREKAKSAYLAKDQFIANMSHEIRTPLNSIIGYSGLLQKTDLSSHQKKFTDAIRNSGNSLLHLVNEILDFGKLQEGTLAVKKEIYSVHALFDQLNIMFHEASESKLVTLSFSIDPALPLEIVGDENKVRQILVNLINNALKFTQKGKVSVNATHVIEDKRNLLELMVVDSGIGIHRDHLSKIFERFYQVDSASDRRFGGTGLGLTITNQLTQLMDGKIAVESEPGKGTGFTIHIPFEHKPLHTSTVSQGMSIQGDHTKRILVVDDNSLNSDLTVHIVASWNFDVDAVDSGEKAIRKIREGPYDLVLMDIQMPIMDGYRTAAVIRNDLKNYTPIIALTAHASNEEREKCIIAGMNDYVSKPFDELELFNACMRAMSLPAQPTGPGKLALPYLRTLSKGNVEFEKRILNRFLQETPLILKSLETKLEKSDADASRKIIHNLRPNIAIVDLEFKLKLEFEKLSAFLDQEDFHSAIKTFFTIQEAIEMRSEEVRVKITTDSF